LELHRRDEATSWLADSVRGFLSGAVAKRMKLKLVSAKSEDGSAATQSRTEPAQDHFNKEPSRYPQRLSLLVFQSDEKTASRRGDGLWPSSFHHFPLTSIGPQFACGFATFSMTKLLQGLPPLRFQSELFPYGNEDSGSAEESLD
jgi:hypothetical protein